MGLAGLTPMPVSTVQVRNQTRLGALLAFAVIAMQAPVFAQQNLPPAVPPAAAQPAPQQDPAAQPPARKEGFVDALGRWLDQGAADFKANLEKMKEFNERALQNAKEFNERALQNAKEFNEKAAQNAKEAAAATAAATKEATDALVKLPNTRLVEGRETCTPAPNGSPDCQAAAEKICKAKGFQSGKSADIQQVRKCSARAWLGGGEDSCRNESIVIRATCQ